MHLDCGNAHTTGAFFAQRATDKFRGDKVKEEHRTGMY
jgi:hypothetical protein